MVKQENNEKIVYQKPQVVDLGAATPFQGAEDCLPGSTAPGGTCTTGGGAAKLDLLNGPPLP